MSSKLPLATNMFEVSFGYTMYLVTITEKKKAKQSYITALIFSNKKSSDQERTLLLPTIQYLFSCLCVMCMDVFPCVQVHRCVYIWMCGNHKLLFYLLKQSNEAVQLALGIPSGPPKGRDYRQTSLPTLLVRSFWGSHSGPHIVQQAISWPISSFFITGS